MINKIENNSFINFIKESIGEEDLKFLLDYDQVGLLMNLNPQTIKKIIDKDTLAYRKLFTGTFNNYERDEYLYRYGYSISKTESGKDEISNKDFSIILPVTRKRFVSFLGLEKILYDYQGKKYDLSPLFNDIDIALLKENDFKRYFAITSSENDIIVDKRYKNLLDEVDRLLLDYKKDSKEIEKILEENESLKNEIKILKEKATETKAEIENYKAIINDIGKYVNNI